MKIFKFLLNIFLIVSCFILQIAILSNFKIFVNLNLIFCLTVFFVLTFNFSRALLWALVGGFLLDFYSLFPFGNHIFIFLSIILILRYLLKNFFSHRSFYSLLILIIIGVLIYNLELLILGYAFSFLKMVELPVILDKIYLINFLGQIILNTFIISLLIILFEFQKKFRLNL